MKVLHKIFASMGNNCYLIVDEETNQSALVDCPEYNEKMIELIGNTQLQYILLTHGHFDHIIGARDIKAKYSAKVVISTEDEPMLHSSKLSLAAFCNAPQNDVDADILVKDNDIIKLGSIEIKVISTPGHTKGGVCYLADNYLFSGDTLFCCSCGRTDFPGGSGQEMLNSFRKLKALDGNLKVMPGHEELSELDFERKNNPYMNM